MSAARPSQALLAHERDLLRDFCVVYATLSEQNARFALSGTVSHAVLVDLLGRQRQRGVFWRLLDVASRLFWGRGAAFDAHVLDASVGADATTAQEGALSPHGAGDAATEQLLDWCLGYAFHECLKLKEDAFLRQHLANRLAQLRVRAEEPDPLLGKLASLAAQTRESAGREVAHVLQVLDVARDLLIALLRGKGGNGYLARYLTAQGALVRGVFGQRYAALLSALYTGVPGPEGAQGSALAGPEDMRALVAARASLEAGRPREALSALDGLSAEAGSSGIAQALRRQAAAFSGAVVPPAMPASAPAGATVPCPEGTS